MKYLFSLTVLLLYVNLQAIRVGTKEGVKKPFAIYPKTFSGEYLTTDLPFYETEYSIDMTFHEATGFHYVDMYLIPGNTYYYCYKAYKTGIEYTDQREPIYRLIYISSEPTGVKVYIDGVLQASTDYVEKIEVYDDWGYPSTPLPPENITAFYSIEDGKFGARLSWSFPKFKEKNILDLYGGFYQIWRGTVPQFSKEEYMLISTIPAQQLTYRDETITPGSTYYYVIISADAYIPPTYSVPSTPIKPEQILFPLRVVLNVIVSKIANVKNVSLVGDFTGWTKKYMVDNKDGSFSLLYYDPARIFNNTTIEYKYIINDTIIEEDFPEMYGGPNRKITLRDEDGDGFVFLYDVFNVPTATATASNLAEEIVAFYSEIDPEKALVKLIYEINPPDIEKVNEVLIFKADDEEEIPDEPVFREPPVEYGVIIDTNVADGQTVYYRLRIVRADGTISYISDPIKTVVRAEGDYIPRYIPITTVDDINLQATHGADTALVNLSWLTPQPAEIKHLGPPLFYIIRISTFSIGVSTDAAQNFEFFKKQKLYVKSRSLTPGTTEFLSIKIVDKDAQPVNTFPGFFYTIAHVYGINRIDIKPSKPAVAPVLFNVKKSTTLVKGNRTFGIKIEDKNIKVDIPKYAFRGSPLLSVIRNAAELYYSDLKQAIAEANEYAKRDARIRFIPENEFSSQINTNSLIFSIELYRNIVDDYFADEDKDGLPDQRALRDFVVSIPYDLHYPAETLSLYCLSRATNRWYKVPDVKMSLKDGYIKIEKLGYFGTFAIFQRGEAKTDLGEVVVYPNPFVPYDGDWKNGEFGKSEYEKVVFSNMTKNTEIFIYNTAAELVKYHKLASRDDDEKVGMWRWDIKSESGNEVASGMYIVLFKDEEAQKKGLVGKNTKKLVIIK